MKISYFDETGAFLKEEIEKYDLKDRIISKIENGYLIEYEYGPFSYKKKKKCPFDT